MSGKPEPFICRFQDGARHEFNVGDIILGEALAMDDELPHPVLPGERPILLRLAILQQNNDAFAEPLVLDFHTLASKLPGGIVQGVILEAEVASGNRVADMPTGKWVDMGTAPYMVKVVNHGLPPVLQAAPGHADDGQARDTAPTPVA